MLVNTFHDRQNNFYMKTPWTDCGIHVLYKNMIFLHQVYTYSHILFWFRKYVVLYFFFFFNSLYIFFHAEEKSIVVAKEVKSKFLHFSLIFMLIYARDSNIITSRICWLLETFLYLK